MKKMEVIASKHFNIKIKGRKAFVFMHKDKRCLYISVSIYENDEVAYRYDASMDTNGYEFNCKNYSSEESSFTATMGNYKRIIDEHEEWNGMGLIMDRVDNTVKFIINNIMEMGFTPNGAYLTAKTNTADSITYSAVTAWNDNGSEFNVSNLNFEFEKEVA